MSPRKIARLPARRAGWRDRSPRRACACRWLSDGRGQELCDNYLPSPATGMLMRGVFPRFGGAFGRVPRAVLAKPARPMEADQSTL